MVTTVVAPTIDTVDTVLSHWTTDLLQKLPHIAGERYEIIDGELYVTRRPHSQHQLILMNIVVELGTWSRQTNIGRTIPEPGLVYADDQAVVPDLVWVRREHLATIFDESGHLRESPDLVVEILSASKADAERDREKKLALYSRQQVPEYWIVDWRAQTVEIYRHDQQQLVPIATLQSAATLTSPLLSGFSCAVSRFFE
ncbi:MAG: Uma2 family endonuclease [Roseiflexaceae bacterium]|nr:Uma2 family endonuclease [Roseiflexaceae bacterium]